MKNIEKYRELQKLGNNTLEDSAARNEEKEVVHAEKGEHPPPSAPPCGEEPGPKTFSRSISRQRSILARGVNSECVVCLDNQVCNQQFMDKYFLPLLCNSLCS